MLYVVIHNGRIFLVVFYYFSLMEKLAPMIANCTHGKTKSYRDQIQNVENFICNRKTENTNTLNEIRL